MQRRNKRYYKKNRLKVLAKAKEYYIRKGLTEARRTTLTLKNGKALYGLNKRPHTGYCEMCGKVLDKRLVYHHWDDSAPSKGIWVCNPCHWFVEGFERGLKVQKYLDLKSQVSNWK